MNFFSKYVKRFQQGGTTSNIDPQAVLMAIMVSPETFAQADENLAEFVSNVQSIQSQEDIQAVISSNPEAFQECAQIYASNKDAFDQAIAQAQNPVSQKMGGVISYLDCLKKGGSVNCGCTGMKNIKLESGSKIKRNRK